METPSNPMPTSDTHRHRDWPENVPGDCHEKIRQIVTYWLSIHPADGLPGRQHLDPLDIPQLLPNVRLQDVVGVPPRIRMRLMGTRVVEFFGKDHTGKWLDDVSEDFANSGTYRDFLDVVREKQPSWRQGRARLVYEKDFVTLERVHLPLARDGTTVDMVLTCMVFRNVDGSFV